MLHGARPGFFFDPSNWDADAALQVTLPPRLLEELGEDEARRRIGAEVKRQVAKAHAGIRASYGKVLGAVGAKHVNPFKRAKTWETFGVIHPTFATGPGRVAERVEAAEEVVAYRQDYRAAWRRYRDGDLDVVFPYGCYLMRVRHHVRVAPAPS